MLWTDGASTPLPPLTPALSSLLQPDKCWCSAAAAPTPCPDSSLSEKPDRVLSTLSAVQAGSQYRATAASRAQSSALCHAGSPSQLWVLVGEFSSKVVLGEASSKVMMEEAGVTLCHPTCAVGTVCWGTQLPEVSPPLSSTTLQPAAAPALPVAREEDTSERAEEKLHGDPSSRGASGPSLCWPADWDQRAWGPKGIWAAGFGPPDAATVVVMELQSLAERDL